MKRTGVLSGMLFCMGAAASAAAEPAFMSRPEKTEEKSMLTIRKIF